MLKRIARIFIKIIAFCIIIIIAFVVYLEIYSSRYHTTPRWCLVAERYVYTVIGLLRGDYEKVYARSLYPFDSPPRQFAYISTLSPAERSRWWRFFLRSLQYTGQGEKIPEIMRWECVGYQNLLLDKLHMYSFVNEESKKENLHEVSRLWFEIYAILDSLFNQDIFLKEAWEKAKLEETLEENTIMKLNYRRERPPSPWVYWWHSEIKWDISTVRETLAQMEKEDRTIEEYYKLTNYYLRCLYLLSHILVAEGNIPAIERMWQMCLVTEDLSWKRDAIIKKKSGNLFRQYYESRLPVKQAAGLLSADIKAIKE